MRRKTEDAVDRMRIGMELAHNFELDSDDVEHLVGACANSWICAPTKDEKKRYETLGMMFEQLLGNKESDDL